MKNTIIKIAIPFQLDKYLWAIHSRTVKQKNMELLKLARLGIPSLCCSLLLSLFRCLFLLHDFCSCFVLLGLRFGMCGLRCFDLLATDAQSLLACICLRLFFVGSWLAFEVLLICSQASNVQSCDVLALFLSHFEYQSFIFCVGTIQESRKLQCVDQEGLWALLSGVGYHRLLEELLLHQ